MNSKHSIGLAIGALFVLVACNSRPAYGAPPSDACSLLTQAQVSAALGVNVGEGKQFTTKVCRWSAPGQSGRNAKQVTLTLQDAQAFVYAKTPVQGITKTPVSGIGDDAVYGTTPGFATTLAVKKGNLAFVVHVDGFPIDEIKAKEKTLALEILFKL